MKTPEEILTNHFGSSQVDGYRANIIDAMLDYASKQLKAQADNHRKDMAMKIDLLRQQHDAEMVEFAEWIGKKDGLYVDKSKWAIPDDNDQDDIYLTTSVLLAQFRNKEGGHE